MNQVGNTIIVFRSPTGEFSWRANGAMLPAGSIVVEVATDNDPALDNAAHVQHLIWLNQKDYAKVVATRNEAINELKKFGQWG